jgi:hypothetical protein
VLLIPSTTLVLSGGGNAPGCHASSLAGIVRLGADFGYQQ